MCLCLTATSSLTHTYDLIQSFGLFFFNNPITLEMENTSTLTFIIKKTVLIALAYGKNTGMECHIAYQQQDGEERKRKRAI